MAKVAPSVIAAVASASNRIFGFIRDILMAQVLGAGPVSDAVLAAFWIPNAVRRTLAEGGLNPAFIPNYSRLLAKNPEKAHGFAMAAFSGLLVVLLAVAAILEVFASALAFLFFPGLEGEAAVLAVTYMRLSLPLMVGTSLAANLAAVLLTERRIAVAALAPNVVHIVMIVTLIAVGYAALAQPEQGWWVAAAVGFSGVVHLAILVVAMRRYFPWFRLVHPQLSRDVRIFLKATVPTVLIVGTAQTTILAATFAASFLPSAVSWLYYAEHLFHVPLGFAAAIAGLVVLPQLSALSAEENKEGCHRAQNHAVELSLLFSIPAAAGLFLLARPIMEVLFERGAFTAEDTIGASLALQGLALGLPFAALGKIVSQTVFVVSPLRMAGLTSIIGVVTTLVLALLLSWPLEIFGITLAVSCGLAAHALSCVVILNKAGFWRVSTGFHRTVASHVSASLVMGLGVFGYLRFVGVESVFSLLTVCVFGAVVFVGAAVMFGAVSARDLAALWRHGKRD
ncbi:MAG: murein biosynthesis integral membrane protein MurJ [Methylobacteriaceae bacterium]|jgi:putative peptidoglycan lipid II flippase|nr:murein biosynthesis integral membrane protein MurJ [Methylobacteriaceae bacterium]